MCIFSKPSPLIWLQPVARHFFISCRSGTTCASGRSSTADSPWWASSSWPLRWDGKDGKDGKDGCF